MRTRVSSAQHSSGRVPHIHGGPRSSPAVGAHSGRRPPQFARWRAATLIGVYALFAIHIAHWKLNGKTLAPLELNEVMYTLEHGVLTAGFIFMSLAVVSVMIFGRFFCSWGCHILALQDLCEWLLRKMRIPPKPVRSRALLLVPIGAMLYMFAWPQIGRLMHWLWPAASHAMALPPPAEWKLRVLSDLDQGQWASFVTTDFWRNLPGPWISVMTFAVVGFIIVYLLGTRSFCTYGCPYGAIFALADRLAPGKIMLRNRGQRDMASSAEPDNHIDCASCGLCTAACQSHIRVHQELTVFGRVVSPACLKDLDCVAACPNGAVTFGFTTPGGFKSWRKHGRFGVPYDFTLSEDVLMSAAFLATLFIYRGLYDAVPFLMTIGLGAIMAYVVIMCMRLFARRDLRLNKIQLRIGNRMTLAGYGFAAVATVIFAFTAHSGVIRYHEIAGRKNAEDVLRAAAHNQPWNAQQLAAAIRHLQFCSAWGLVRPPMLDQRLASLMVMTDHPQHAEPYIRRLLQRQPYAADWRFRLAAILLVRGDAEQAVQELYVILAHIPHHPRDDQATGIACVAYEMLGDIRAAQGRTDEAAAAYRQSLQLKPDNPRAGAMLRRLLAEQ